MISQVFILSSRGDVIIFKDYRNELPHDVPDLFYRSISDNNISPYQNINGINFISICKNDLYFVSTVLDCKILPSIISSFLLNFIRVVKDYCGIINETSIRNHFVMVYEILDEILDYGFIQDCSTSKLKPLLANDAVESKKLKDSFFAEMLKLKTKESSAAARPVAITIEDDRKQKNEVYVDIIENLAVTFNYMGEITRSDIFGKLIIKSYLKGDPEIQIGLLNNLLIKSRDPEDISNRECILDDINFHPCVNQDTFDRDRSIHFYPSDGETTVLSYRSHDSFTPPFKLFTQIEEVGKNMIDLIIKLNPTFPSKHSTSNITLSLKAPKQVESVSFSLSHNYDEDDEEETQSATYRRQQNKIIWKLGKIYGGCEQILRVKFNWDTLPNNQNILKEIGLILLDFEIPMYLCSHLQIRYLKILERSIKYEPDRWVRYLSKNESYKFRL